MISLINYKQSLSVRKAASREDLTSIQTEAENWEKFAQQARLLNSDLPEDDKERLSDCELICSQLGHLISNLPSEDPVEVFVCKDEKEKPQAVMSIWTDLSSVTVMHLVTNPANLIPEDTRRESDPKPVRGAAKTLTELAIARAAESESPVELDAYPLAEGFYEKMGFTKKETTKISRVVVPMILTLDKIRQLYPHHLVANQKAS